MSSGRGETCRGLRSKNLPEVLERIVQGGRVSRGVEVVVEVEEAEAEEERAELFFGGGLAAVAEVARSKDARRDGVKRIVDIV